MSFWEPDRDRGLFMGVSYRKWFGPNLVATWFESWSSIHLTPFQHVSACFPLQSDVWCIRPPPFLLIHDFTLGSEAWTRGSGNGGKKLKSKFCERFSLTFKQSSSICSISNLRHNILHAFFSYSKIMCVWWRMKDLQCCVYRMQYIIYSSTIYFMCKMQPSCHVLQNVICV